MGFETRTKEGKTGKQFQFGVFDTRQSKETNGVNHTFYDICVWTVNDFFFYRISNRIRKSVHYSQFRM